MAPAMAKRKAQGKAGGQPLAPVDAVFTAKSIAVVGASRDPKSIGYTIVRNLVRDGFKGTVYPVNPKADHILSIPAFPSVGAIPGNVDLAVICVPAAIAEQAVEECGRKGVRAAIVITAGFGEIGEEGRKREQRLEALLAKYGIRAVGPNCMGCVTTSPDVSMNATFALGMPERGRVAMMSQSGALSAAIMEYAREEGIGISKFVSMGNILNVDTVDLLEYFGRDKETAVVLMYIETFGDAARFASVCRPLSKRKPIMAVKGGRTAAGARAAASHTGALAGSDAAVQSVFDQCGVIRANTLEELFDFTHALVGAPLPKGRNVAIVTDAGGPAIMATDSLPAAGLTLARLSDRTKAALRAAMPPEASVENPVDMIASADSVRYRKALKIVLDDPGVDGAIVICVPPVIIDVEATAEAISKVAAGCGKPVLGVFMGADYASKGRLILESRGVPSFTFPESAVRAYAAMADYARIKARPVGRVRTFRVDRAAVRAAISAARRAGRTALKDKETLAVLKAYGIPMPTTVFASSADEAIARAREIGFPVVLKVTSPKISHKTEVGGVILDLRTDAEVFHAYHQLLERAKKHGFADALDGVIVQQMVKGGQEIIAGAARDDQFGHLVAFGLGGVFAEYFKDVNFRIAPLTDVDARELVRSIRAFPVLQGVRGAPPADIAFLEEVVQRVSQLVADFPEIASLDLNPFRVFEAGKRGLAVDARVFLANP